MLTSWLQIEFNPRRRRQRITGVVGAGSGWGISLLLALCFQVWLLVVTALVPHCNSHLAVTSCQVSGLTRLCVMLREHHRLSGRELEQTPGDIGGWRRLVCCSPWGHKEPTRLSDGTTTARLSYIRSPPFPLALEVEIISHHDYSEYCTIFFFFLFSL